MNIDLFPQKATVPSNRMFEISKTVGIKNIIVFVISTMILRNTKRTEEKSWKSKNC